MSRTSPADQDVLLRVDELSTWFAKDDQVIKAADKVSFSIKKGEIVGLVGESGSGKTVTARSIARLISPPGKIVGGQVFLGETSLLDLDEDEMNAVRGDQIGMLFQEPRVMLDPTCRVGNQVGEPLRIHRSTSKRDAWSTAVGLLRDVEIPDPEERARSYAIDISGGMAQRVMIATALAAEPDLLIADEPTTALDVTVQAQILQLLQQECRERGMAMLLITHDLGVVAAIADRVLVMYSGQLVAEGTTEEILRGPLHPYTCALVACASLATADGELVTIRPSSEDLGEGCRFFDRCDVHDRVGISDRCRDEMPSLVESQAGRRTRCHAIELGHGEAAGV